MEKKCMKESELKEKQKNKYAKRMAFSKFVKKHEVQCADRPEYREWRCCGNRFLNLKDFHKHVSQTHLEESAAAAKEILEQGSADARWKELRKSIEINPPVHKDELPTDFSKDDVYQWLPIPDLNEESQSEEGRVLLFYKYGEIGNAEHVKKWQECLCSRLGLTGKVRVAGEGLNVTVGGTIAATQMYMDAVRAHPYFSDLKEEDFKTSKGGSDVFPEGLKVGVYKEVVPMGINPEEVSYKDTGVHLSVDEFHNAVQNYNKFNSAMKNKAVFVDCRNFYESKVGNFKGSVTPDIRKFSYWPEYIDKNRELFADKDVYMYCTGGIRCERGSAYLKHKGITDNVFQLSGGIHKYIEKYPDGFFRGKLFVFDERYAIKANEDILTQCTYCGEAWDKYQPCSSNHCHQLVLICEKCRQEFGRKTCCYTCQKNEDSNLTREECECTKNRPRIPVEHV